MLAAELLSGVHAVASVALARTLRPPVLRLTVPAARQRAGHLATVIAMNERFTVPPEVLELTTTQPTIPRRPAMTATVRPAQIRRSEASCASSTCYRPR